GTLVGVLPGIGPLAGISILLPVTYGLDATKAIVMLAGIYYGSQYGGSTTSILMRIPGEASSVMTCIDGYAMAQKGRAGAALCIAAVGSFIAGTLGVVLLTVVAPPLASFALRFGPPEYTALLVLGLIFLAYMSSTSLVRTLLMASFGLLLGMIGIDVLTGHFRYSFDIPELGELGVVLLTVVAPPLASFALRFGPPEYTALLVLGLIFLAYMSSTSLVRTLLMASFGLLLGMIGIDVLTGHFRYSFDIPELG